MVDYGQGRRGSPPGPGGIEAGRAVARDRYGLPDPDGPDGQADPAPEPGPGLASPGQGTPTRPIDQGRAAAHARYGTAPAA
jgi:hypothetical protein